MHLVAKSVRHVCNLGVFSLMMLDEKVASAALTCPNLVLASAFDVIAGHGFI